MLQTGRCLPRSTRRPGREAGHERAENALALAVYRDEQDRLKQLLCKELRKCGKPMSLDEVRATLDQALGETTLRELVITARKESPWAWLSSPPGFWHPDYRTRVTVTSPESPAQDLSVVSAGRSSLRARAEHARSPRERPDALVVARRRPAS